MTSTNTPTISVFIPVYNGEQFLKKSIESVLNQTYKDFELVCVDDSSLDNSYDILKSYSKIDKRILVFKKPNGGNVPKSWNFIMPYLSGKFITYMSQDDWMSADNLEINYKRYLETGANIIIPDLTDYSKNGKIKKFVGVQGNRNLILSGREAFILSLNWKIHGFCLCESKLMKSELFDENSFNSDEYVTRKNFLLSRSVAFSNGVFYHNNDNPNSITKQFKPHTLTALYTDQRLIKLIKDLNIERKFLYKYMLKSFARMLLFYFHIIILRIQGNPIRNIPVGIFKTHLKFLLSYSK